ncbi:MAG: sensor histidine kinase, partial [Kiritimatiellae bacterium]|nr:sensor histidine kinase [Kiritimatiellia bacterium]
WTPGRLMIVIGGLLAVILGIIVRNKLQKRKAAMLAKFSTELKVEERTRLAVELHDSLAQNLTGVSLEIDTAGKLAETDPKAMREHLGQATRTLKSCRDELRNCIWDLRNRALEESSMDEAIRQTLAPHVIGVDVAIRFNVPRERISDNTAHAILRSIRELAINAVRHGKATKIWIAGSIDGDNLLFSVRDNGTGFDPATAPGFAEGHYGLVGITERIEALEGEFNIESSPGSGAKATARISARRETLDTRRDVLPTNASPSSHV